MRNGPKAVPPSGSGAPPPGRSSRPPRGRRPRGPSPRSPRRSRPVRTEGTFPLPEEAFTLELAELVTAADRARIDRWPGSGPRSPTSSSPATSRKPFPAPLTSCGSTRRPAVSPGRSSIVPPGPRPPRASSPSRASPRRPSRPPRPSAGLARGEAEPVRAVEHARPARSDSPQAQGSPDEGLRASALAIGPLAGLPIEPSRFRADVLKRPHLAAYGFLGLVGDRSLSPRAWQGLFTELFSAARTASRDPSACTISSSPVLQAEGDSSLDRYCNLFAIVHFAALDLGDDEDPPFVSRDRIGLLGSSPGRARRPPS